ncbi:MAG: zinc-dependent metalloprotease [Phycisphaerales bacterium]|nr:zinc-dependent metalloprotease [Phycisphaerales bacterium]
MRTPIILAAIGGLSIAAISLAADTVDGANAQIDTRVAATNGSSKPEFPKYDTVIKSNYNKVVSTADGKPGMYTLYVDKKTGGVLAELPRNYAKQNIFFAYTISGGIPQAGVQAGDMYAHWKKFGKRLALIQPNYAVRSTGDKQSRAGTKRVFTDTVILDVPIKTIGPGGGPVIDLTDLLVKQSSKFFGSATSGANTRLATVEKAKAFPKNIELAFGIPLRGGKLGTLAYSIAEIPENTGYKPRVADERIGYFTTAHRDIGDASVENPWKRYVNRWDLKKADPKLKMSPPKKPIVFYVEHTTPVRYRRWVRDGILEWNEAFENIGIVNAIEVYQQDADTGAHMEKDPEDARYNFFLWTNADMGFAIGPSRVHPKTGEILDADIVMDEGFINGWSKTWKDIIPEAALEGYGPNALAWLAEHPEWHPRVLLADQADRSEVHQQLARESQMRAAGILSGFASPTIKTDLIGDERYDGLIGRVSQINGNCQHAACKAMDVAMVRLNPNLIIGINKPKLNIFKANDPVSGTWYGSIEMAAPDGTSHAMDLTLDLTLSEDNSVSGTAEMGMFGTVDMQGDWSPTDSQLTLYPADEEEGEDALIVTIDDGNMTGGMTEGDFSMSLTASRSGDGDNDASDETVNSDNDTTDEGVELAEEEDGDETEEDAEEEEVVETASKDSSSKKTKGQYLDGVPEEFIGPMLREVVMHEVGHTLGLRHNFKGSTIHTLEEINSEEFAGQPHSGSVMDYLPININYELGEIQGDWTQVTVGPYDMWAIEYGYTAKNPEKVLKRVAEPQLAYATDEDTSGPDPRARRFDNGENPLIYAESQIALVQHLRSKILDEMVEDGESWSEARKAYDMLLNKQLSAINIAANWIGGSYLNRDKKGDAGDRDPIVPIEAEQQRHAMQIVLDNTMRDDAYGLSPQLLRSMTVDKWWDDGGMRYIFQDATYPIHDRIASIQAMAMNGVLNPQTLNRVYDNEFRATDDEDVLTVPEVLNTVRDSVWGELDGGPQGSYTARSPYITSLRRNAQREHINRLIDLSMPSGSGFFTAPVSNLSRMQLRELKGSIDSATRRKGANLDPYSQAHLAEASSLIDRALNAQYLYNTDDIAGGGGGSMFPFMGQPANNADASSN